MAVEKSDLIERTVDLRRVTKVVKGGRRFSFSAFVVVGDGKQNAGYGLGKANEVSEAIRKATEKARKSMKYYSMYKSTIPHAIVGKFGAGKVVMKPASSGSGIIASSTVRTLMECVGIRDISVKSLGCSNPHNILKATINGLSQMRSFEEVAELRGKDIKNINLSIY